ncbi:MAG: LTA synthase family protein, partial [Oscillospiraceae bacterium]|nr:LTA synthase family protein [Oscillospiraceae bacterium]
IYTVNVMFYLALMAAAFAILRNMKWSAIVTTLISYTFNIATFIVNMLRGIPLIPSDFLAIGTAMQVAENYVFTWESPMVVSTVIAVFAIVMLYEFSFSPKFRYKNIIFASSGASVALILVGIFATINYSDVTMDIFDQYHANNTHGVAYSFFLNTKGMRLEKPETYDAAEVEKELNAIETDYTVNGEKPNVLVIMNESFADLSVLGELETNEDYMPFYNSLKKNTVKGELLVSPFGGYTCNTEFEVLTGMSMGLLPTGSAPYLQYMQMEYPYSLPNHMSKLGYTTVAVHPYFARCWNRDKVYGLMGFDNFISLDNMGEYQNANEFEYIRNYLSDRTSYSAVINQFENKKSDERMFVFNVTMQNHGGYASEYSNFVSDVEITNLQGSYSEAEQYLSLIKESDKAFEELVYYFSKWDEPIIIVMFGDHQPAVEQEFYEEMLGKPLDSLTTEELQDRYRVPFIMWANFDIESEEGVLASPNYLSNILMEKAGLPESKVNIFLDKVYEEIPQINAMGHYDKNGNWNKNDTEKSSLLNDYNNLEYYMLKQKNKKVEE